MNHDFDVSIINIANDFYNAYLRCSEGKNPVKERDGRIRYEAVNVPAIVNGAFAIELYLKNLSPLTNKELKKKRHSIKKLFLTLDADLQNSIKKEVEEKLSHEQSFESSLNGIDNAFTFWRYIHTKRNFGYGLNDTLKAIPIFLTAIRNQIKVLNDDRTRQQ